MYFEEKNHSINNVEALLSATAGSSTNQLGSVGKLLVSLDPS